MLCFLKNVLGDGLTPTLALELLFSFPVHSTLVLKDWQPVDFSSCSSNSVTSAFQTDDFFFNTNPGFYSRIEDLQSVIHGVLPLLSLISARLCNQNAII